MFSQRIFLFLTLFFLTLFNDTFSEGNQSRPNFVVILCDDLGYGDLGCYGHPVIRTPHLDQLAKQGVRLTDCYASAPVCSPSRAGMITGRIPNRVGVYDWIPDGSPMHVQSSEVSVATLLKNTGYDTCHVGKWHCNGKFNDPSQPQPDEHGFEHWFSTQNNSLPTHANPINFVRNGKEVGNINGYSSTIIVDEAIRWLDQRENSKPFCLFVWFHSPHEVIATSEKYVREYRKKSKTEKEAIYFGNVTQMDDEVGRLVKKLDKLHPSDETLLFFTSDNGPETLNRYGPNSSRSYGSPKPLRGMKLHMYEGGIRVPGIIRWTGKVKPFSESSEPVSGVDVLPTLCQLGGVKIPSDRKIDGASFVPLLSGKKILRTTPLYWQYNRAISLPKIAMRDGKWKLLSNADFTTIELYNLEKDPEEKSNLATQNNIQTSLLLAKMKSLHAEIKKEGPTWPTWSRKKKKKSGKVKPK